MTKFKLKLRRRNIPKEDLLTDLNRVADALHSDTVTGSAYDEKGMFGKNTLLRTFGSWNNALKAAGLKVTLNLNIPKEMLFKNLAEVWENLEYQPVGKDIEKSSGMSKYSLGTYEKRFGSWNKALIAFIDYINENESVLQCIDSVADKNKKRNTSRKINWRLRAKILIRDGCICKMCGASPTKDPSVVLHVHHIKPWSKGGDTVVENLQTLCSICNIGKSDEIFDDKGNQS